MDVIQTGQLIRQLRKERGWTQQELADHLMISDRTVSKWERGRGYPDVSLVTKLSQLIFEKLLFTLALLVRPSIFLSEKLK